MFKKITVSKKCWYKYSKKCKIYTTHYNYKKTKISKLTEIVYRNPIVKKTTRKIQKRAIKPKLVVPTTPKFATRYHPWIW